MSNPLLLLCVLSLVTATAFSGCVSGDPAQEVPAATGTPEPAVTSPSAAVEPTPTEADAPTSADPTPGATSEEPATADPAAATPPADSTTAEPTANTSTETPATTNSTAAPVSEAPAPAPAPVSSGPAAVDLRSAGSFAILSKSGISTVPASAITGDIATSPIASTAITGFSLVMDSTNTFATSPQVTGKVYAADYTSPTPSMLTTAVSDMQTAYTDAAGRSDPTATEVGAGEIGSLTITPGLYKWGTSVLVSTSATLDAQGNPDAVWIFQIAGDLKVANGKHITLAGGAKASNIFWQVAGHADIGTGAHFEGNLLTQNAISLKTGATMNGRALAQTAVTLDASTITRP